MKWYCVRIEYSQDGDYVQMTRNLEASSKEMAIIRFFEKLAIRSDASGHTTDWYQSMVCADTRDMKVEVVEL